MDPFFSRGVPNVGLGQAFSPLTGFGGFPQPALDPTLSLAAARLCGVNPGAGLPAPEQALLQQQMQVNQLLLQMLSLLLQLMASGGNLQGLNQLLNGAGGNPLGDLSGAGGAGGSGSAGGAGSSGLTAPPADPNAQIPNFGGNPSKQQLNQQIEGAASKYGIPPDILKAIFYKESGWNPAARGDGGKSYGIGQVYTTAHPDYDVARGQQDVSYQIEYSARLLSGLYKSSGDWRTAVRKYNGSGPMAERYADDVMNNLVPSKPWQKFLS